MALCLFSLTGTDLAYYLGILFIIVSAIAIFWIMTIAYYLRQTGFFNQTDDCDFEEDDDDDCC